MKITDVTKSMTYYVSTDASEYPDYRTDETGTHWENAMGDSWEPVYTKESELQEMFREYMKQNKMCNPSQGFYGENNNSEIKFSDLPNNSWEKVMVNLVEHIGGDGGFLVKWGDKIPDPVETATSILNMVQDFYPDWQGYPEDALAKGFRALYKLGEYEVKE